ncbi:hypothetical protein GCM10009609_17200 [Pseudonocardia aurantiaca]
MTVQQTYRAALRWRRPYAARQLAAKAKYALWITPAEHDAISRVDILRSCPDRPLPS